VCLVTGASRGLGRAIALDLGAAGCKVVVNYSGSKEKAEAVCEEIKGIGGDAIAVQADCKYYMYVKVEKICSVFFLQGYMPVLFFHF